jgi:hypothetical protein
MIVICEENYKNSVMLFDLRSLSENPPYLSLLIGKPGEVRNENWIVKQLILKKDS